MLYMEQVRELRNLKCQVRPDVGTDFVHEAVRKAVDNFHAKLDLLLNATVPGVTVAVWKVFLWSYAT